MLLSLLISFFTFPSVPAQAQLDPSQAVLLGTSKPEYESGLQSGRYERTPSTFSGEPAEEPVAEKKPASAKSVKKKKKESSAPSPVTAPSDGPVAVIRPASFSPSRPPASEEAAVKAEAKTPEAAAVVEVQKASPEPVSETPAPAEIEAYKEQVHPDDSRLNRIEVEVGSGVFSADAKSNSAYREFSASSPLLQLGGKFWISPFVGISGRYQATLNADMSSSISGTDRVPTTFEFSDLQLNFRKYFGLSRKANLLEYGILYSSEEVKVPADNAGRVRLKSAGWGVHAQIQVPTAPSYTWTFGGSLIPHLAHSESSTGLSLNSGSGVESSRFGLSLGGIFRLSRENVIFWDLTGLMEKNQFEGTSNVNEPGTGSPAGHVSVMTSTGFVHFGYRWGR